MEENNQNTNINEQQSTDSTQNLNAQPVNNSQNMNTQQPMNNYQNMNTQQPMNNYQDMNAQQPMNNYQDMNAQQPMNNYQDMNAQQPMNNYQDMNTQQPMNNYQDMNMQQPVNNYQNQATNNANPNASQEKAPVLLRILCFFIPLVGLILYAVKYSSEKAYAKSCGIPALIGFILGIVLIPLIFIIFMVLGVGAAIYDSASSYDDYDTGYSYYYNRYEKNIFDDLEKEWKL